MSPVHIPRGFTKAFIRGDIVEDLGARIEAAHGLAEGREALLIEGTGHAGVGAVIGLSNADVAARLGAPAVIVSEAGMAGPSTRSSSTQRSSRSMACPSLAPSSTRDLDADPSLVDAARRVGASRHRNAGRAALPADPPPAPWPCSSSNCTGSCCIRATTWTGPSSRWPSATCRQASWPGASRGDAAHPARRPPGSHRRGRDRPRRASPSTPDDRALSRRDDLHRRHPAPPARPRRAARAGIFAYLADDPTFEVASRVHGLLVKTHPANRAKIVEIKRLVSDHFDVDGLLDRLDDLGRPLAGAWS